MSTQVKTFEQLVKDSSSLPASWDLRAIVNEDNITYIALNTVTQELIVVDPMIEDWAALLDTLKNYKTFRVIAVIDTHTHADHISCAAKLANEVSAPLVMHKNAPSAQVDFRVSRDTALSTAAGPLHFLLTPGHTWDSLTPIWGPFVFTGDTLMYGDAGRDDLPTGNGDEHFASIQKLKSFVKAQQLVLVGHDAQGGRISSWKTQLEVSPPLTMDHATFMSECGNWVGPAPKILKESLLANFK